MLPIMHSILLFWNYTVILRIFNQIENKVQTVFTSFNILMNTSYCQRLTDSSKVQKYDMQSTILRTS